MSNPSTQSQSADTRCGNNSTWRRQPKDIGGVIELRRMFVRAEYRRRGVATSLVRALIEHSGSHGVCAIELWTGPNGPGKFLYQTLGFRQTEGLGPEFSRDNPTQHRYFPAEGDGQIRMRLDL